MRQTLDDLETRYKLTLSVEDGWLKATWMPIRFFIIFLGRFDEQLWRKVLRAMHTLVGALEGGAL